jgi:putative colanic acid biosynthesis UDP-glucose lipid carrier transferase
MLRLHSGDLNRLLRLLDPLVVMALFWLLVSGPMGPDRFGQNALLATLVVGLVTALILPQFKLYQSYRQSSLITLMRRLTTSWMLVVGALLALAFGAKVSATFSRVDVITWAALSWAVLFAVHVGGRKLLRWHRILGGNSRTILYWGLPEAAIEFQQRLLFGDD